MLMFQEFLEHFRVLLPRNAASQEDIAALMQKMGLDNTTYQIGKTKVIQMTIYEFKSAYIISKFPTLQSLWLFLYTYNIYASKQFESKNVKRKCELLSFLRSI